MTRQLKLVADLPGMEKKDIDVSLEDDVLTIKDERNQEKEESGKYYHSMDRRYGGFYRSLRLPAEVQSSKINASLQRRCFNNNPPQDENSQKGKLMKLVKIRGHAQIQSWSYLTLSGNWQR